MQHSQKLNVQIHSHKIIYTLLDMIKDKLSDLLEPEKIVTVQGEAQISQLFTITVNKKPEMVCGCKVLSGSISKNTSIRILRNKRIICEDLSIKTFKHHKKDITDASKGLECGIGIGDAFKPEEGDVIQSYSITLKKRVFGQH